METLSGLGATRPVWLEAESKRIGRLQLPDALVEAMARAPTVHLEAPMAERVRLWREDYPHFAADPQAMVGKLDPLKPLVGGRELELWHALADAGRVDELFERVMALHYDPCYARSTARSFGPVAEGRRVVLESLGPEGLAHVAGTLLA